MYPLKTRKPGLIPEFSFNVSFGQVELVIFTDFIAEKFHALPLKQPKLSPHIWQLVGTVFQLSSLVTLKSDLWICDLSFSSFSLTLISWRFEFTTIIPPFSKPVRCQSVRVTVVLVTPRVDSSLRRLGELSLNSPGFFLFPGGLEPKKLTYIKSKTRTTPSRQKEQTRLQLANCKAHVTHLGSFQTQTLPPFDAHRLWRRPARRQEFTDYRPNVFMTLVLK